MEPAVEDTAASTDKSQNQPEEEEKVFQCDLCEYKTAFRASLLNHQVVHSDARPWMCKICSYAAKRKFDLKKHLQIKHRLSVDREIMSHYMFELNNPDGDAGAPYDGTVMSSLYSRGIPVSSSETIPSFGVVMPSAGRSISPPLPVESSSAPYFSFGGETIKCESDDESVGEVTCIGSNRERTVPVSGSTLPPFHGGLVSQGLSFQYNQVIPSHTMPGKAVTACVSRVESLPGNESGYCQPGPVSARSALGTAAASAILSPPGSAISGRSAVDANSALDRTSQFGAVPSKRMRMSSLSAVEAGELSSPRAPAGFSAERCSSVSSDAGSQTGVISSSVMRNQGTETRRAFHCTHCDVMYFDNAMFLMHAGLHRADNPWTCAICQKSFGEKYSFTSHFINQHT